MKLDSVEKQKRMGALNPAWKLVDGEKKLFRRMKTTDFKVALKLVQELGELAEKRWHHPEISFGYGFLEVTLWTYDIKDLAAQDFELAQEMDLILK